MNSSGNLLTLDQHSGIPPLRMSWREMACGVSPYGMTVGTCIFFEVLMVLYVICWGIISLASRACVKEINKKKKKTALFFSSQPSCPYCLHTREVTRRHAAECSLYVRVCGFCASGADFPHCDVMCFSGRREHDADEVDGASHCAHTPVANNSLSLSLSLLNSFLSSFFFFFTLLPLLIRPVWLHP